MTNYLYLEQALVEELEKIMEVDSKVVLLTADVGKTIFSDEFLEKFQDSIYNFGIAEQNMVSVAAGMATAGLKPVVFSFASFLTQRSLDQVINSVVYPEKNVKLIGFRAGLASTGGESHTATQDLSIMRSIPKLTILSPCSVNQTHKLTRVMMNHHGPVYMRIRNESSAYALKSNYDVEIGGAQKVQNGEDLTIIATGLMVSRALLVSKKLKKEGISARVIDMYSIKPFNQEIIRRAAAETGRIITIEENNIIGGLGSLVSEVVTDLSPCPVLKIGIEDKIGTSGQGSELFDYFGLTVEKIYEKVKNLL